MSDKYDIDFARYLAYSPLSPTGLIWKPRRVDDFKSKSAYETFHIKCLGEAAGAIWKNKNGYRTWVFKLFGNQYINSRIIYTIMVGDIPYGYDIDHKDTNPMNNKIENLRLATRSQNQCNKKVSCNNILGVKGVRKCGNRFQVIMRMGAEPKSLGVFDTIAEASLCYKLESIRVHGEFARAE